MRTETESFSKFKARPISPIRRALAFILIGSVLSACGPLGKFGRFKRAVRFAATSGQRTGLVRLSGNSLRDDGGEFRALGASLLWGLWGYKNDRAKLERALDTLSRNGFDYIRVLGQVDWAEKPVGPQWSDYDQMIAEFTDLAFDRYGLRVEWSLIGGGDTVSSIGARKQLIDRFIAASRGREQKIIHFEIANEYDSKRMSLDELRELTRYMKDRTDILVAASAGSGGECDTTEPIYAGGVADIATVHFSRSAGDNGWRHVRQAWGYGECKDSPQVASNNEPIGPGSSIADEKDPLKLVMAAVNTYVAKLPMYVYHSRAGVGIGSNFGLNGEQELSEMPAIDAFRAMQAYMPMDIANWTRHNSTWSTYPFIVYGDGNAGAVGDAVTTNGAVRAYAATSGDRFLIAPIGIRGYLKFSAKQDSEFDVLDPVSGNVLDHKFVRGGESFTLQGKEAYVIIGKFGPQGVFPQGSTPVARPIVNNALEPGQSLNPEQSLYSNNRRYRLSLQLDGNLVLFRDGSAVWASNTTGFAVGRLNLQPDGNLIIFDASNRAMWTSKTNGNNDARLVVEDDGRVVIYSTDQRALWTATPETPDPGPATPSTPTPSTTYYPPFATGSTGVVEVEKRILPNQSVISMNGQYRLTYQLDGNLVIYHGPIPIWSAETAGRAPGYAVFQTDGNFVIYDASGSPVWDTATGGSGRKMQLQDDGNLVIYGADGPVWASQSN